MRKERLLALLFTMGKMVMNNTGSAQINGSGGEQHFAVSRRTNTIIKALIATILITLSAVHVQQSSAVEVAPDRPVSTQPGDQTEPSIAVNPNDPNHLIAGAIEVPTEDCRFFVSFDGGDTWSVTGLLSKGGYQGCTDPALAFDSAGDAYFAAFFYDRDAGGRFSNTRIGVAKSTDDGQSYANPVFLNGGTTGQPSVDKPHIAIDTSGSYFDGTIYVVWTTRSDSTLCDTNICGRDIRAAVSRDGGMTFGDYNTLSESDTNNWGAHISIEKDGNIYVTWRRFHSRQSGIWLADNQLRIAKSITTGRTWRTPTSVVQLGEQADTANVDGTWRTSRYPVAAVSPTQCRGKDFVCEDVGLDLYCENSDCDVYVAFADDPPSFIDLDLPGDSAWVNDINNSGQMVGYYITGGDLFNGFIYEKGNYKRISLPDASFTFANGINDAGRIVGYFRDSSDNFHGFVLNWAGYDDIVAAFLELDGHPPVKQIDFPGASHTFPYAINNVNQIVGAYEDASGVTHGFLIDGDPSDAGSYKTIDYPGAESTEARDINDYGEIAGFYKDSGDIHHGFLLAGEPAVPSNYVSLEHPTALETFALGMNNSRVIVGRNTYADGSSGIFVYNRSSGLFVGLPYYHSPAFNSINAVNNAGEIVMTFKENGGATRSAWGTLGKATQSVWVATSHDGGSVWQTPVRVNDSVNGDQFDPWMCVDDKGRIHVSWLDRRDDGPDNLDYHLYYANSADGARSFSANRRISTIASNPRNASLVQRDPVTGAILGGFIGDYIGQACSASGVHPVWPDMRDGIRNQNIYTARISCGLHNNGDGTVTDSCADRMWVQNTTLAAPMNWEAALSWAETLVLAGYRDWRLPRTRFPEPNCEISPFQDIPPFDYSPCIGSELPQLVNAERADLEDIFNLPGEMSDFWSETEFQQDRPWRTSLWRGSFPFGFRAAISYGANSNFKNMPFYAWAVRDIRPGDTGTGTNIETAPTQDITVQFAEVTAQGATTVTVSNENPGGSINGFEFLGTYYDIATEATYTQGAGNVTVCIAYQHSDIPGCANSGCPAAEGALVIQHWDGAAWENVTTSRDIDNNIICGTVASLSWFSLGYYQYRFLGFLPPVLNNGGSKFNSGRTIPVKFQLADAGGTFISDASANLTVKKILNGVPVTVETVASGNANAGTSFRYDFEANQYVYNLSSAGYSPGTYLLQITLNDGSLHEVQVSIK